MILSLILANKIPKFLLFFKETQNAKVLKVTKVSDTSPVLIAVQFWLQHSSYISPETDCSKHKDLCKAAGGSTRVLFLSPILLRLLLLWLTWWVRVFTFSSALTFTKIFLLIWIEKYFLRRWDLNSQPSDLLYQFNDNLINT